MTKKSLSKDRKAVMNQVQSEIDNGIPKQEILEKLSEEYFDKSMIAKMLASTTDQQTKSKYKTLNNILLGLLLVTIIAKILIGIEIVAEISLYALPIILLLPLINIWLAFEVSKYRGYIYKILGILTIAGMLQISGNYEGEPVWMLMDLAIGAAIVGLSFYLGNKMFPNFGFFGFRKDDKGNVVLE